MASSSAGPRLSVNVNKVATLRNSRGGSVPSRTRRGRGLSRGRRARHHCSPAPRCTPHHADRCARDRALARATVRTSSSTSKAIPARICSRWSTQVRPDQCTLVPVKAGEITSQAGWPINTPLGELRAVVQGLQRRGVRVSLFVEADPRAVEWAASVGARAGRAVHRAVCPRLSCWSGRSRSELPPVLCRCCRRARSRSGRERRPRSRPRQSDSLQNAAAPRRSVDRARAHQPRAVRRPRTCRARVP